MSVQLNQAIIEALGLSKERNLTHVTLKLSVGRVPELTLRRAILDDDGMSVLHKVEWRELVSAEVVPPKPFDIGEACDAALLKVRDIIDRRANFEHSKVRESFRDLRNYYATRFNMLEMDWAIPMPRMVFGAGGGGGSQAVFGSGIVGRGGSGGSAPDVINLTLKGPL